MELGWGLGLVLVAVGGLSTSIGMVIMKHSSAVETELETPRLICLRPWWVLGFLLLVIVPLPFTMVALSITPITLIAPFGGLNILFAIGLAHCGVLSVKETISMAHMKAIVLLLLGVTLVSIFGPHGLKETTLEDAAECYTNIPFVVLFASCMLIMLAYVSTWLLPEHRKLSETSPLSVVLCSFTAAACGAYAQLLLKVVAEAMGRSWGPHHDNQLDKPSFWICLASVLIFAPFELYLLNSVLASCDVVTAVPIFQALLLTLTVATGGVFFKEFGELTDINLALFTLGGLLVGASMGWLALLQNLQARVVMASVAENLATLEPDSES